MSEEQTLRHVLSDQRSTGAAVQADGPAAFSQRTQDAFSERRLSSSPSDDGDYDVADDEEAEDEDLDEDEDDLDDDEDDLDDDEEDEDDDEEEEDVVDDDEEDDDEDLEEEEEK